MAVINLASGVKMTAAEAAAEMEERCREREHSPQHSPPVERGTDELLGALRHADDMIDRQQAEIESLRAENSGLRRLVLAYEHCERVAVEA